ncbi:MAG: hypothetical protein EBX54_08100, partial [Betaproteobacteria bacterium]|nr:hypothetical protein [Betaproteobacteria bacterium]
MYAILARVPIQTMLLAGLLPALVMVICLLCFGGFMRRSTKGIATPDHEAGVTSLQDHPMTSLPDHPMTRQPSVE